MRLKLLTEERKKVYIRSNGDSAYTFHTTRKSSAPPFVIALHTNDRIVYAISITAAGKAKLKELWQRRKSPDEPLSPSEEDLYYTYQQYAMGIDGNFNRYPDLFNEDSGSPETIAKILYVKYKIPKNIVASRISDFEEDYGNNIEYGDTTIIPTKKPNKTTLTLVTGVIDELRALLDPKGLHTLVAGEYRLGELPNGIAGLYYYGKNFTALGLKGLRRGTAIRTLVHECAHKWDDIADLHREIDRKHKEVWEAGNRFTSTPVLSVGDILVISEGDKQLNGLDLVVSEISNGVVKINYVLQDGRHGVGKINIDGLLKLPNISMKGGSPIAVDNKNPWFPTNYSQKNSTEFFAELVTEWIYGDDLDPEAVAWLESLPKP